MILKAFAKIFRPQKNNSAIIFGVITLALGFLIAKFMFGKICREGVEGRKELLLLHMEGCPHCVELMPKWNAASKKNKTNIRMRSVEKDDSDGPALCKKYNVDGFPTMLLLKDGKKISTCNERSESGILNFLSNHN